jgi:hypothetical protein
MMDLGTIRAKMRKDALNRMAAAGSTASAAADLRAAEATVNEMARLASSDRDGKLAAAKGKAEAARTKLADAQKAAAGLAAGAFDEAVVAVLDPEKGIAKIPASTPILLLPLRMETRFRDDGKWGPGPRMLVRLYPDDCLVEDFHPELSEAQRDATRLFWAQVWAAGGFEEQKKAAWSSLIRLVDIGRASWAITRISPSSLGDAPQKTNADDVIIVLRTALPTSVPEQTAVAVYWQSVARSGGEPVATERAYGLLVQALGADAAAAATATLPYNLPREAVPSSADIAVVDMPLEELPPEPFWPKGGRAEFLPDRFVLIGVSGGASRILGKGPIIRGPLMCSPDPDAPVTDWQTASGARMQMPDAMQWMTDFGRALDEGMAFNIDLKAIGAEKGFDELIALGLRLDDDVTQGAPDLAELLRRHRHASGLSVVPQGTPTNNTEEETAPVADGLAAEQSYSLVFGADATIADGPDGETADGKVLSSVFALPAQHFGGVPGARNFDIAEAKAMNTALWPATWGFSLEAMLKPAVSSGNLQDARSYFIDHVSGRGALPALRIKRQPYGILPTTVYSRFETREGFESGLKRLLDTMAADWTEMARSLPTVFSGGDPHQRLLDIIDLHPASIEHYIRVAQSEDQVRNHSRLARLSRLVKAAMRRRTTKAQVLALLRKLGYAGEAEPPILGRIFQADPPERSYSPLIEDQPLSETRALSAVTDAGLNYIDWLAVNAEAAPDTIRRQSGFSTGARPSALLFRYLRHALLETFAKAADGLLLNAGAIDRSVYERRRADLPFLDIAAADTGPSASHFASLYAVDARVTGDNSTLLIDFLTQVLPSNPDFLGDTIKALSFLRGLPTARLERLFCEHLDLCSYRLDAWRLGMVHQRLARIRQSRDPQQPGRTSSGLVLGAFGYLHDVRPKVAKRVPVAVPTEMQAAWPDVQFAAKTDSANSGFVLTPSLNHAVTAAVLRAGYHGTGDETLKVNLQSERVRLALLVQDGLRQGQSLGAILGYLFERGVHDAAGTGEAESLLQTLRGQFPLVSNHIEDTAVPGAAVETIEARNVVDGLRLLERVRVSSATYPFGLALPAASAAIAGVINDQVRVLLEAEDALADVTLAESVHQMLMSNATRAAGGLETMSQGRLPGDVPDVLKTPRSGRALTQKLALALRGGVAPAAGQGGRSAADPAVAAFLATRLPPMQDIALSVDVRTLDAATATHTLTAADLRLSAIDLVWLLGDSASSGMLDELVATVARQRFTIPSTAGLTLSYGAAAPKFRFADVSALARNWRSALGAARGLIPEDMMRTGEANSAEAGVAQQIAPERVSKVGTTFDTLATRLEAETTTLAALVAAPPAATRDLVAAIEARFGTAVPLLAEAQTLRLPGAETAWLFGWKAAKVRATLEQLQTIATRWAEKRAAAQVAFQTYNALPNTATAEERQALLQAAERASSAAISLEPGNDAAYRVTVTARMTAFDNRLGQLTAALGAGDSLAGLIAGLEDAPPLADFDRSELPDLGLVRTAALAFARDMEFQLRKLSALIRQRIADSDALIAGIPAGELPLNVAALRSAGRALLGEDAPFSSDFTMPASKAQEFALAHAAGQGTLMRHADTMSPAPLQDWLHGLARLRPKVRALEQATMIGDVLLEEETPLSAVQLPHRPDDYWLGGALPPAYVIPNDALLFTGLFGSSFDGAQPVTGMLIDEWVEVIPGTEEMLGLTYHYNRPNSEPPQAWLLSVSPKLSGSWEWRDLVDGVRETVDLAKLRAVDPTMIEKTPYAQLLPATVLQFTSSPLTLATILSEKINLADFHG